MGLPLLRLWPKPTRHMAPAVRSANVGKFGSRALRQGNRVNFVERYLGVSHDGGDGLLEILFIVLLVLIVIAIWLHIQTNRRTKY